ncbi:type 4a pilus biogenesis protein PilO [Geoalkalibacter sp.]|uniref:type 4a pilus biogenesis protein PilO n=1 Tax=Geoalkalibacter sp. TaxID=3041440 RepID=UPI00272E4290|nr:type 4a pilus biogenesis protein PilO [Geoalkalibacter sp.]
MKPAVYLRALWQHNRVMPILVGVLLAANLALFLADARLLAPRALNLQQEILHQQEQLRRLDQAGGAQDSPRDTYQQGREDLAVFFDAIPQREELSQLVGEVFGLAKAAGLVIERITYDPQQLSESPLLSYTLVFSVNGNYEQLKQFIFSLEHSPRIIALNEIAFSGGDAARRTTTLNLRFTTYFRGDAT